MKIQFAVADIGTLLLHPERYESKAEAEATIDADAVTAPLYQVVELRFADLRHEAADRLAKVRDNERRRHEKHAAEEAERERAMTPEERDARHAARLAQRRQELEADEAEHAAKKQESK